MCPSWFKHDRGDLCRRFVASLWQSHCTLCCAVDIIIGRDNCCNWCEMVEEEKKMKWNVVVAVHIIMRFLSRWKNPDTVFFGAFINYYSLFFCLDNDFETVLTFFQNIQNTKRWTAEGHKSYYVLLLDVHPSGQAVFGSPSPSLEWLWANEMSRQQLNRFRPHKLGSRL